MLIAAGCLTFLMNSRSEKALAHDARTVSVLPFDTKIITKMETKYFNYHPQGMYFYMLAEGIIVVL